MDWIKKYSKDVAVGVMASIVGSPIIYIIGRFIEVVPTIGNTVFETIKNTVYTMAASQTDSQLTTLIISIFLGIVLGIACGTLSWCMPIGIRALNGKRKRSDKQSKNESDCTDIKYDGEKIKRTGKKLIYICGAIVIEMLAISVLAVIFIFLPANMSSKFQTDIVMIYPYVEETEIRLLQSDWVCMRSESDYLDIYRTIDVIKQNNNLP